MQISQNQGVLPKKLTTIIRQSEQEYVGVCLEVNVAAQGETIPEVESNLVAAVNEYLDYAQETGLEVEAIPIQELIEFLEDTSKSTIDFDALKPTYTFHQLIEHSQYA